LTERHHNPNAVAHGAVPFTLMDTAMGAAAMSVVAEGRKTATIEIHCRFLASVGAGPLTAVATVISAGRRIITLEARTTDENDRLIATSTASFAVIEPRVPQES
jgi:acyl-CoA thioesterase